MRENNYTELTQSTHLQQKFYLLRQIHSDLMKFFALVYFFPLNFCGRCWDLLINFIMSRKDFKSSEKKKLWNNLLILSFLFVHTILQLYELQYYVKKIIFFNHLCIIQIFCFMIYFCDNVQILFKDFYKNVFYFYFYFSLSHNS